MQTTQSPEKWVYIDSFRIYSGRQAKRAADIKKQEQTSKTCCNQWKNSGRQVHPVANSEKTVTNKQNKLQLVKNSHWQLCKVKICKNTMADRLNQLQLVKKTVADSDTELYIVIKQWQTGKTRCN